MLTSVDISVTQYVDVCDMRSTLLFLHILLIILILFFFYLINCSFTATCHINGLFSVWEHLISDSSLLSFVHHMNLCVAVLSGQWKVLLMKM